MNEWMNEGMNVWIRVLCTGKASYEILYLQQKLLLDIIENYVWMYMFVFQIPLLLYGICSIAK